MKRSGMAKSQQRIQGFACIDFSADKSGIYSSDLQKTFCEDLSLHQYFHALTTSPHRPGMCKFWQSDQIEIHWLE
jgi:hypothetical protein